MFLNSWLLDAHGCPLCYPCHIRPGFHHVLQSTRARSQPRANIPSGGGGNYNYPSRLGQALDAISPVTLRSNSAAPIPGTRRATAGSQRGQGPRHRRSARSSSSLPASARPSQLPSPPPRARAAAGHLHRNPGRGLLPRGVRRVTITTGRSPRRPPGRK